MKKPIRTTLIGGYLLCMTGISCYAQEYLSKYLVGVNAGTFIYQGDLTESRIGSWRTPSYAFGIQFERIISESFRIRADLTVGQLKGDDASNPKPAWRRQRNLNFKSPLREISASLVYYPKTGLLNFQPYICAGYGVAFLDIKRDYSKYDPGFFDFETTVGLTEDIAHPLPRRIQVVPAGIGVKYILSEQLAIQLEAVYHYLSDDYLDGFSRATNPSKDDSYTRISVGFMYRLGKKSSLDCPANIR